MYAVNVSGLKNNPTGALRMAQTAPVLVMNRDQPHAVMLGVAAAGELDAPATRRALACALFRDGGLSLVRSARLAQSPVHEFVRYLAVRGIPVVNLTQEDAEHDLTSLDAWLTSSLPTPVR